MSTVRDQITNAFSSLGLAPSAAESKVAPKPSISSADAIALEEQYSAHKSVLAL